MVCEVSRLLEAYSNASAMESVALKAAMVFPALMLQKPQPKNKAKLHVVWLEDRLRLWLEGEIDILLHEGGTIQQRLQRVDRSNHNDGRMARSFEKLVSVRNGKAVLRLATEQDRSGGLSFDIAQADGRTVRNYLLDKHPQDKPVNSPPVSNRPLADEPHHVLFDEIDGPLIRSIVQGMLGAASPSGLDAKGWKRMCCSFRKDSDVLCSVIANLTRRLCSTYVDPGEISALVTCRLVALDKNPGIRPTGIRETLR